MPVYDNEYTKTKARKYGDKVYTNFRGWNVPKDGVEWESFINISTNSLLVYKNKYYLQVYFCILVKVHNWAYKIVNIQMMDYLGDKLLSLIWFFFYFDQWIL